MPCPADSHYDSDKKVCFTCPEGTIYIEAQQACQTKVSSNTTQCSEGAVYNFETKKCVCPEDKPYDNGVQCISCDLPHFWNAELKYCDQCEDGFVYNAGNEACENCPEDAPIEKDGRCVACPSGSHYNWEEICIFCGPGTEYDDLEGACLEKPTTPVCPLDGILDQSTNTCSCPEEKPHNTGSACVKCDSPTFWSEDSKTCITCQDGHIFNSV